MWFKKKLNLPRFPYTILDLTHTLSPKIPSWEGNCCFECKTVFDYQETDFRIQRIEMMAGSGTHMDAPSHSRQGGETISEIPLERMISPCIVIDVSDRANERYSLSAKDIFEFEKAYGQIPSSSFVIVRTGWDRFWDHPEKYRNNLVFPSISEEAVEIFLKRDISGIGIDTLSPDRPEDGFCVHEAVFASKKYLVENVANSHLLPPIGCYSMCLPLKIVGATEAPVRLVALVPSR